MYHRYRLLLLAAVLFLVSVSVNAQVTTATLVGLVRDNSAAVIPGASVVATHEGTGVAREGMSDANGEFVLAALPAGPYSVRIELSGFKTISQRGIQLGAGQTVRQTFTLEVGDHLIIEGAPPRDSLDRKVLVRKVWRPATDKKPAWEWAGNVR